jgi:hypothetical protein
MFESRANATLSAPAARMASGFKELPLGVTTDASFFC